MKEKDLHLIIFGNCGFEEDRPFRAQYLSSWNINFGKSNRWVFLRILIVRQTMVP